MVEQKQVKVSNIVSTLDKCCVIKSRLDSRIQNANTNPYWSFSGSKTSNSTPHHSHSAMQTSHGKDLILRSLTEVDHLIYLC